MAVKFIKDVKSLILEFSSTVDNIEEAVMHISDFVTSTPISIDVYGLKLVLSEGITNAVVHGNKEDCNKIVDVKITLTPTELDIKIADDGKGFDWKDRLKTEPVELFETSGRGIELIKAYGYSVSFNKSGNLMFLRKSLV